jgi:hypothetical protein
MPESGVTRHRPARQPLGYEVPEVVRRLWRQALDSGFNDELFERNFSEDTVGGEA